MSQSEPVKPKIFQISSKESSPKQLSPEAKSLQELESFQEGDELSERLEEALEEEGFTGRPMEEQPPEVSSHLRLHLLVIPPGASPIYVQCDSPEELMTLLYKHLEPALLFQEIGSWSVYAFEGERLPLVGDLARGSVSVRHAGRLVQIPEIPEDGEELPAGQLLTTVVTPKTEIATSTSIFGDNDDEFSLF